MCLKVNWVCSILGNNCPSTLLELLIQQQPPPWPAPPCPGPLGGTQIVTLVPVPPRPPGSISRASTLSQVEANTGPGLPSQKNLVSFGDLSPFCGFWKLWQRLDSLTWKLIVFLCCCKAAQGNWNIIEPYSFTLEGKVFPSMISVKPQLQS